MVSIAADQNPVASTLRSIDSLEGHGHDLTQTGEGILADVAGEGEMPDSLVRKSSLNSETGLASAPPQVGSASASASTALGFGLSAPTQSIMSPTAESGSYSIDSLHESDTLEKLLDSAKSSDAEELLEFGSDKSLWGQQLGSRIITMVAEDVQQAKIHLDPPELGSLEIQLSLDKSDELRLQIQTQSPQVREVLEAQAHRLRESLSGQGMALAEFDVSDLSQRENHSGQGTDDGRDQDRANESEDSQLSSADLVQEGALAGEHSHTAHQGLVSTFV
jgi:flagellar hook-length control protein FliK